MTISLKIPIVLWGEKPPSHQITCISFGGPNIIVTGSYEGQLIFWILNHKQDFEIIPQNLIMAHTSPIDSLAHVSSYQNKFTTGIISLADNQEICLWNTQTFNCISSSILPGRFNKLLGIDISSSKSLVICYGNQNRLLLVDPFSMSTLYILKQISLRCSISTVKDVSFLSHSDSFSVFALSHEGILASWNISNQLTQPDVSITLVGKFESLPSHILKAKIRFVNVFHHGLNSSVLMCSNDSIFLCSYPEIHSLSNYSLEGKTFRFVEIVNSNTFIINFADSAPSVFKIHESQCEITMIATLPMNDDTSFLVNSCVIRSADSSLYYSGSGNDGRLGLWRLKIDDCEISNSLISYTSLEDVWKIAKPMNILKNIKRSVPIDDCHILCSLQLQNYGFIIFGLKNGLIIVVSTIELILNISVDEHKLHKVSNVILTGHTAGVTYLCHPYEECERHDPCHLLSGGADFTVRLWNIVSGCQLKVYHPHGGVVEEIFVICNDGINSTNLPVVSVASDYSVSLINLCYEKEVLTTHSHASPVISVKIRFKEDLLLAYCVDGTLYVWQILTGNLERRITGKLAAEIFEYNEDDEVSAPGSDPKSSPVVVNMDQDHNVHHHHGLHLNFIKDIKFKRSLSLHANNPRTLSPGKKRFNRFFNRKSFRSTKLRIEEEKNKLINNIPPINPQTTSTSPTTIPSNMPSHSSHHLSGVNLAGNQSIHHSHASHSIDSENSSLNAFISPYDIFSMKTGHRDCDFYIFYFDVELLISHLVSEEEQQYIRNMIRGSELKARSSLNLSSASSVCVPSNSPPHQSLSLITLTLGLCPTTDGRSYLKYCQSIQNYHSFVLINTAKLLISCFHPWGIDPQIDEICLHDLELSIPSQTLSYGIFSNHKLQLTLPGYKYVSNEITGSNTANSQIASKHLTHWQFSSFMTTQHIVTLLSLSEAFLCLYNPCTSSDSNHTFDVQREYFRFSQQVIPVEGPSGRQFLTSSVPDLAQENLPNLRISNSQRDGWKILHRNHSCIISRLLVNDLFCYSPIIHLLLCYWLESCPEIRNACYSSLLSELIVKHSKGRQELVCNYFNLLPSPEEISSIPIEELLTLHFEDHFDSFGTFYSQTRDRTHQTIAVFLISFIMTEFPNEFDPLVHGSNKCSNLITVPIIINLATLMSKTLTSPMNVKKQNLFSFRRAFVFMLGKSFTLWQPHLNLSQVIMSLLDTVALLNFYPSSSENQKSKGIINHSIRDLLYNYRYCLRDIMMKDSQVLITFLNKEISRHYNTHGNFSIGQSSIGMAAVYSNIRHQNNPLSTQPNILQLARSEIVNLIYLMASRIPGKFIEQILQVIDLLINSSAHKLFKKDTDIFVAFPFLKKFNMIDYCPSSRRLAIGTIKGQFGLYDIRNLRCNLTTTFSNAVTCLKFSPDGKHLVLYSYDEMKLCLWQVSQSILGILTNNPKHVFAFHLKEQQTVSQSNLHKVHMVWDSIISFKLIFDEDHAIRYTL